MTDNITRGTGNVFADVGLPDAGDRQIRTRLVMALNEIIKARRLRPVETARLLGIPQPKVSALANFRLDGFSVEKLMGFLTALDQDVEIMIRPRSHDGAAEISVLSVR